MKIFFSVVKNIDSDKSPMEKSHIKILVVEDDETLGKALEKILSKDGYKVFLHKNPNTIDKTEEYQLAIIDCMLPSMNGVKLAEVLYEDSSKDLKIILMSGIFKDKNFLRQSQKQVPFLKFFQKPFENADVLESVNEIFIDLISPEKPLLYQLLHNENFSKGDVINAVNNLGTASGYDLPLIFSSLCLSKATGYLHLENAENKSEKQEYVSFKDGKIVEVVLNDQESYFGVLLIENGFTSPDDVNLVLKDKTKKRIGEKLIDASVLSPHAIEIVQIEQMSIRMSKSISGSSYNVNFVIDKIETENGINFEKLRTHLYDWINTKIDADWLEAFYRVWSDHSISKGVNIENLNNILKYPNFKDFNDLITILDDNITISEYLEKFEGKENSFYCFLHYALNLKILMLSKEELVKVSDETKIKRLKKIFKDLQNKSYLEILGVNNSSKSSEILRSYQDLAKKFHPDKVSNTQNEELMNITTEVFSLITEAYNALKSKEKRSEYVKERQNEQVKDILQSESFFENGLKELNARRYRSALESFERSFQLNPKRGDLHIYLNWAKIKNGSADRNQQEFINTIHNSLGKVPPEFRHSPQYFHTKALFYQMTGNHDKAEINYEKAISIDRSFMPAKQELSMFRQAQKLENKKESLLEMSVTNVMSSIFKKK